MTDLLEQTASWLDAMRSSHLSRTIVYSRGALSVAVLAMMGGEAYEVSDEYGVTTRARSADFVMTGADLVLGDETVTPAPGDRITVVVSGKTLVFEVMNLGGAGHYRPNDPYGKSIRVHAKCVEAA